MLSKKLNKDDEDRLKKKPKHKKLDRWNRSKVRNLDRKHLQKEDFDGSYDY